MVEMAAAAGFAPVLGVLWCSYVPGTRLLPRQPRGVGNALARRGPLRHFLCRPTLRPF